MAPLTRRIQCQPRPGEAAPTPGNQDAPAPAEAAAEGGGEEGGSGGEEAQVSHDGDTDWNDSSRAKGSDDEESRPQIEASGVTLRDHLMEQARLAVLSPA